MKKKIVDERGLLFGKISVVDILAVLLVAALGLMVYVRFFTGGEGSVADTGKTEVEYVIRARDVRMYTVNAIHPGDCLYHREDDIQVGVVKDVRVEEGTTTMTALDGATTIVPRPGYYDLYITVRAEAVESSGGYYLGGTRELSVNLDMPLSSPYAFFSATVVSIG